MRTKTTRKLATLAATAAIAIGSLAAASPATANSPSARAGWSGYKSCSPGQTVVAQGGRGPSGTFWIVAGGIYAEFGTAYSGGTVDSMMREASWEVGGTAATWGTGFCR